MHIVEDYGPIEKKSQEEASYLVKFCTQHSLL